MKKKELEERKTERVDYSAEMTNEEYRDMIIRIVHNTSDTWVLEQIYRYAKNMTKEG